RTLGRNLGLARRLALPIAPPASLLAQLRVQLRDSSARRREFGLRATARLVGRRHLRRLRPQVVVQRARVATFAILGARNAETELESIRLQGIQRAREHTEVVARRRVVCARDRVRRGPTLEHGLHLWALPELLDH